ncbi:hypothetical protein KY284_019329 [Solanum tuberosum]|nr:hypothetical protein KY284_019329 [Solanum tuberosum]
MHMEFDLLLLSPIEAIAALLTLAFTIYFFLSTKKSSKPPLPPEIAGGWPVIGHLFYFDNDGDDRPLARKLSDLADKYGPVFTFRLGLPRVLVISSSDAVKDCYSKNDAVFANRPAYLYGEYLGYNNAVLFLANYGPYWRNIRKLVIQEVLSNTRLEKLKQIKLCKIRNNIKNLHSRIQNTEEKSVVNLTDWLEELNFGLIVQMIAGKNYESGGDGDGEMERFKEAFRKFQRWLDEHVKTRETSLMEVNGGGNERDFIDVMLSKMSNEHLHGGYSRDIVIKATVFSLVLDAADTVSLHINWGMTLLINNQHVLKKAQEEIDMKIGKDRWIDDNDIKDLVYLQAIVKEVLRLYPPGPLLVPHENMEDCVVSGYHIPKGTRLYTNVMKLQRDPKIWSNPDQFNPDRFFTTDIDFRGQDYEFIPFGSGRRSCPGMTYALQVEYLTIGHLIQGFNYKIPSDEPLDMKEGPGMTMRKFAPVS